MDIYLTDLETRDRLRFPMLPQEIMVQAAGLFQSYAIMAVGNIKLPIGEEPTVFTWDGILPGEIRRKAPYVTKWRDPKEIQSLWSVYRAKKKKLRLLITESPINHDVYIQTYNMTYKQGYGDYYYNIALFHAKDLKIQVSAVSTASDAPAVIPATAAEPRPEAPAAKTHTVVSGDSLWAIAQKYMGNGGKYTELYEMNKDVIDPQNKRSGTDRYLILPGQVLTIPG